MDKTIENIKKIVDEESFVEISKEVTDNCVIGYGTVCGKLLYIISDTGKFIDEMYLKKVKHIYELAMKTGAPIVYIMNNQGLKLDDNIKALLTTGASDTASRLNVYDIAGNVWEWTLENTYNTSTPCARRGGSFGSLGSYSPASDRSNGSTTRSDYSNGFRVSLY